MIVAIGFQRCPQRPAGACPRGRNDGAPGSNYDTGSGSWVALHAEQNALLLASWADRDGATPYFTDEPCDGCAWIIRGILIARVITLAGEWPLTPSA